MNGVTDFSRFNPRLPSERRHVYSGPPVFKVCRLPHQAAFASGCFESMLRREQELEGDWVVFYHSYNNAALMYEVQAEVITAPRNETTTDRTERRQPDAPVLLFSGRWLCCCEHARARASMRAGVLSSLFLFKASSGSSG